MSKVTWNLRLYSFKTGDDGKAIGLPVSSLVVEADSPLEAIEAAKDVALGVISIRNLPKTGLDVRKTK